MQYLSTTQKGNKIEAFCYSGNTRNGFKHECEIAVNGRVVAKTKICYLNRTWEQYEYQSVIYKAVDDLVLSETAIDNEKLKKALKRQFDNKAMPKSFR